MELEIKKLKKIYAKASSEDKESIDRELRKIIGKHSHEDNGDGPSTQDAPGDNPPHKPPNP